MKAAWVALCLLACAATSSAQEVGPQALIARLIVDVEGVLATHETRDDKLKLIEDKVAPHLDFEEATRLAAARAWGQASADQRARLVREFRGMLVRTYSSAIDAYNGQTLRPLPSRIEPNGLEASVRYHFVRSGARPVQIGYELHRTKAGWKIYDITVEGMSLVLTYRTDFDAVVKQEGIEGLIQRLAQKNAPAKLGIRDVR